MREEKREIEGERIRTYKYIMRFPRANVDRQHLNNGVAPPIGLLGDFVSIANDGTV